MPSKRIVWTNSASELYDAIGVVNQELYEFCKTAELYSNYLNDISIVVWADDVGAGVYCSDGFEVLVRFETTDVLLVSRLLAVRD